MRTRTGASPTIETVAPHAEVSTGSVARLDLVADLDALFCANVLIAVGALRALRNTGREVPQDVAVVGVDDTDVTEACWPSLTSWISAPMNEGGRPPNSCSCDWPMGSRPRSAGSRSSRDWWSASPVMRPLNAPTRSGERHSTRRFRERRGRDTRRGGGRPHAGRVPS